MTNHYHFLLETAQPNLVAGIALVSNAADHAM